MISLNLTIVITIINFGVLYWLFKRFLLQHIVDFLDKRSEEIARTRSETESDRGKAVELLDEAQGRLKRARIEPDSKRSGNLKTPAWSMPPTCSWMTRKSSHLPYEVCSMWPSKGPHLSPLTQVWPPQELSMLCGIQQSGPS
ncbi:MAG: ATP synthase F0 subunit B [Cryomorphaceae bacterium]|nr:ATP synthase F0 subunit B [Cryomorphaceae bacterium]